jgi:hypothetical protein
MPHERYFQKDDGISMNAVETLRITVKSTTESASENVTKYGYHFCFSEIEPARITGNTGRTQGASTVKIPAKNETRRRVIRKIIISYTEKESRELTEQTDQFYRVNTPLVSRFDAFSRYLHYASLRDTEISAMEYSS